MRVTAAALVAVACLGLAGCSNDPAVKVPTAPTGIPPLPTTLPTNLPNPTVTP